MVSKYIKGNAGFSLIESIVALVVVSITVTSVYYSIQSNILFENRNKTQLDKYFITTNAYSFLTINHKLLEKDSLEGQNQTSKNFNRWIVELKPTIIEGIKEFEFYEIDQNENKIKIKTEYYVYSQ